MVALFIGRKIGEDQKEKRKKSSLQNELAFGPKVCDDKKKVFAYQSVGFRSQKKTNKNNKWCHPKMVTLGAGHQPRPPSDATILNKFVFGSHIFSFVKKMNTQLLVFTAGVQLGFVQAVEGA